MRGWPAHLVTTGLGPVYDGVSHLAVTPEDLIPVIALGLLAGLRGALFGRRALFVLPGAWLLGGLAGLAMPSGVSSTPTVASFLILGALVAADARIPLSLTTALAVGLGLFHGYLNGVAMARPDLGVPALLGVVCSVFVLLALAASLVVALQRAWARIIVRVAGSWIAATGLLLLGWSLRPGA